MILELILHGGKLQADVFLAPQIAVATKRFNIDMVSFGGCFVNTVTTKIAIKWIWVIFLAAK